MSLSGCPRRQIPAGCWDVLAAADLYRRGVPPVAGGSLDQTAAFNRAARMVWGWQEQIKAEAIEKASKG